MGRMSAVTKKGNQQTTNAPVMMTRVFAAFRSLLLSIDSLFEIICDTFDPPAPALPADAEAAEITGEADADVGTVKLTRDVDSVASAPVIILIPDPAFTPAVASAIVNPIVVSDEIPSSTMQVAAEMSILS